MSMLKLARMNTSAFARWLESGAKRVSKDGIPNVGDSLVTNLKSLKPKGWSAVLRKLINKPSGLKMK